MKRAGGGSGKPDAVAMATGGGCGEKSGVQGCEAEGLSVGGRGRRRREGGRGEGEEEVVVGGVARAVQPGGGGE